MNIDERLERLAERQEALTQTVDHLARQGQEQRLLMADQRDNIQSQGKNIDRLLTIVEKLAEVARSHETRLENLEG